MKYLLNGTWVNASTVSALPEGAVELTELEWANRKSVPYVPTVSELTARQVEDYKQYLSRTDFKMTVDYAATLSEADKTKTIKDRAEAREYIKDNEVKA